MNPLASDIYEQANLLKAEGDEIVKNADAKLAKNDPAGNEIAYNEYEKGIKRYKESILASEKARDLSLAQTQAVVDSSADIETNLDLIEKYSSKDKTVLTKITSLRAEYKSSVNMMESGSLRDGFKKAEKIRGESNELMTSVILPYAKERIKIATIKIEDADKLLNSSENDAKSSVATDNLSAAKEAFASSVDLLAKERFYDSIQQTDESIRLADEALKSKENANGDLSAKNRSSDPALEKAREEADAKDAIPVKKKDKAEKNSQVVDSKVQWKKHIVQKRIPPETLWRIAADKKYLGNKDLWKEIYKANKKDISNPNLIYPNQVILIPTKITKPKDKTKK
jgi:nucleoid-associated protein YgaU